MLVINATIQKIHEATLIKTPFLALSYLNPRAGTSNTIRVIDVTKKDIQLRAPVVGARIWHTNPKSKHRIIERANLILSIFISLKL